MQDLLSKAGEAIRTPDIHVGNVQAHRSNGINNADFGRTDESLQQLAIAHIRAIELGRSVVSISTVGTSAIIAPDGTILDELTWYTADAMVVDVPLGTSTTPAVLLGRQIEWGVSALGLIGLLLAAFAGRRVTRR